MATDRAILKQVQTGTILGDYLADPAGTVAKAHTAKFVALVSDAATAGTAVTETVMGQAIDAGIVRYLRVTAPIAVTGHATTNATITVSKRTGAAAAVVVGTFTTTLAAPANSLAAFVPATIILSTVAGATQLAAGDVLTCLISKGSTGVALTAATSYVSIEAGLEYN